MIPKKLINQITVEYQHYKSLMLNADSLTLWNWAGKVNFYSNIYDFFLNNQLDLDCSESILLVNLSINVLWEHYLKTEGLNYNNYGEINQLIENFLNQGDIEYENTTN